jgi:1,4-alpha-glucan branching enzyme
VTDADRLNAREHSQPHAYLGAHPDGDGVVVRAWRPAAASVSVLAGDGKPVPMEQVHPAGVFEARLPKASLPLSYRYEVGYGDRTVTAEDPYRFLPTIGELDLHLVGEGRHEELWERLGAHVRELDGVRGTSFAVWAPSAKSVSVVGDFNYWDGRAPRCARSARAGSGSCSCPRSARATATSSRSSRRTARSA